MRFALLLIGALTMGCGGGDSSPASDAASGADGPSSAFDGSPGSADAPSGAADGAVPDDGGPNPDAAGGPVVIVVTNPSVYADCMPIVASDPWNVSFDASYTNSGGVPRTATITSAKLTFLSGDILDLTMMPPSSGAVPAGGSTTVTHQKVASTPDLPADCGHCGETVRLDVTWTVGAGDPPTASLADLPVMCAF